MKETNQTPEEIKDDYSRGFTDCLKQCLEHSMPLKNKIAELELKLSGKTFSCPVCDSMAERNRELETSLTEMVNRFSKADFTGQQYYEITKAKQLLSNKQD